MICQGHVHPLTPKIVIKLSVFSAESGSSATLHEAAQTAPCANQRILKIYSSIATLAPDRSM